MNKWLASILCLGCLSIVFTACSGNRTEVSAPTATAQALNAQALATQMAQILQATQGTNTIQATATARALASLVDAASQWNPLISDPFDQNEHGWKTGADSDSTLGQVQWDISAGKYLWQAQAKDSFVWWVTPTMADVSDFYLSVDVQKTNGPADGEYGLIFRQSGDHTYYLFEINDKGQYALYYHEPGTWEPVQDWTDSESVLPGQSNRLAVIAQGETFQFFINDQYLASMTDTRISSGKAGLLVGLTNANDKASWEFDNFILREPQ